MKRGNLILLLLVCFAAAMVIVTRFPSPGLSVPLADGSSFELTGTDVGRRLVLVYGGGGWQRILCKSFRRQLPRFVRWKPMLVTSVYTNGIGLQLSRKQPSDTSRLEPWNGSGQLYWLDESGAAQAAHVHCVNFMVEPRGQGQAVGTENIYWEIPPLKGRELSLEIRETNKLTRAVSTHPFKIINPAY